MTSSARQRERDQGELFRAYYPRLVAILAAVSRDPHEAEEAAQDAFVRLLRRWDTVSRYDDPEAWLRKVAFGYLSNRRRKALNGLRAGRRHGPPPDIEGPTADAVDMAKALAALPRKQREVLVLQSLGLGVAEIARDLNVPAGTVKSRLARGRTALAPLLREDSHRHV